MTDIIVALITSATTIIVGVMTAIAAYKAAFKGAKVQIEHERNLINDTLEKQKQFAKKAIESFLSNEIKKNFMLLNNTTFSATLENNDIPFQFGVNYTYKYDEFNNVKYDLIRYESEFAQEIIDIYDMFYLIERKQDVKYFTQKEYDSFKSAFNICLKKYNKI